MLEGRKVSSVECRELSSVGSPVKSEVGFEMAGQPARMDVLSLHRAMQGEADDVKEHDILYPPCHM